MALNGQPLTIWLVEDNPAHAILAQQALQHHPRYRDSRIFTDAESAWRALQSADKSPDLLLLDLSLPGMGGLQLLERLREDERWADLPVAILTCSQADDDIVRALAQPFSTYVGKPLTAARLETVLRTIDHFGVALLGDPLPPATASSVPEALQEAP
ncbi:MAG: response regulator [Phycisphaerae bacterium]